jgi:DNA invertase Pin-like site-specific DNA recombinase
MANIRAALYCRVSTTDQNNALQIRELTEYVELRGVGPGRHVSGYDFWGKRPRDLASSG